jgi:hypothetical protein
MVGEGYGIFRGIVKTLKKFDAKLSKIAKAKPKTK